VKYCKDEVKMKNMRVASVPRILIVVAFAAAAIRFSDPVVP
jgi:hypothetical protein